MKTFNEIMKIRDEPDNKPEVTKRKFQVKKTNNEKMQAFGWPVLPLLRMEKLWKTGRATS